MTRSRKYVVVEVTHDGFRAKPLPWYLRVMPKAFWRYVYRINERDSLFILSQHHSLRIFDVVKITNLR